MSKPKEAQNSNSIDNDDDDDAPPLELRINSSGPNNLSNRRETVSSRDPRFDPRCSGSNDIRHFVRNYSFLDSVRQDELNQLQRALRKEKDPERKGQIKSTISRLKNKMVERKNQCQKIELIGKMKASKGQQGNKFKNVRKSDVKKTLLINKYKELKETGKLTKYLERKRKKLINRDGKLFS